MPSAAYVRSRVLDRIANSEHTLTVHYPVAKVPATGTAPGPAPASPLTGPLPVPEVFMSDPVPSKPAVTVQCLWYQAFTTVNTLLQRGEKDIQMVGWVQGAEALARVALQDASIDAEDPLGDTIFTGAEYVTKQGHRYRILSCMPVGAGFIQPYSLYVWLTGATKQ